MSQPNFAQQRLIWCSRVLALVDDRKTQTTHLRRTDGIDRTVCRRFNKFSVLFDAESYGNVDRLRM